MLLPNLFVPGAGKSGTSSFHDYLGQHPEIFMSKAKEPHFFSNSANFQVDHAVKLEAYAQLFAGAEQHTFRGESSTGYMVFPHVIDRIKKSIDNPRFIFVLRNPIDRAYSHYWWLRGRGHETRPFREAVLADMHELPEPQNRVEGFGGYRYYYPFGQYGKYLPPFLDAFGRNKVFIITTEKMRSQQTETLNACFTFLGLEPLATVALTRTNETIVYKRPGVHKFFYSLGSQTAASKLLRRILPQSMYRSLILARQSVAQRVSHTLEAQTGYPAMSDVERQWLQALYKDDVNALRQTTGLAFTEWAEDFPVANQAKAAVEV